MPAHALAGNDDGILIGGHAALTGGAITATVGDGTAAWYNPAGLARSTRQTLDVNAGAYGLSVVTADRLFTLPDGSHHGARVLDWQLVPSALSYVRQLSDRVVGGFTLVTAQASDVDLRAAVRQDDGRAWTFGVDGARTEHNYLLSVGVRLGDTVRVGASLAVVHIATESMVQLAVGNAEVEGSASVVSSSHVTRADFGARLGAGVQWSVTRQLEVGLALQSPTLTAYRRIDDSTLLSIVPARDDATAPHFEGTRRNQLKGVWELSTPVHLRAGLAYTFGRTQWMIDGSLRPSLRSRLNELDRRWSGNARVASLVQLSSQLLLGIGLFTDLSAARRGMDFVGLAGGLRTNHDYHVQEGARLLSFFTTLGLRYAYGWGDQQGIDFRADASGTSFMRSRTPMQGHELGCNVGGGVNF